MGSGLAKIIAGYHQFHAVRHAVDKTVEASAPQGDRKVGVIWHTQGSERAS
jgi:type I restriction enzyme R subunit